MSLNRKNVLIWIVVVSVSINLFFVGTLTARYLEMRNTSAAPVNMRWVMRDLEPAEREQLLPQIRAQNDVLRPLRMDMFRAQREVNQLLAADPVDQPAVLEAFARLREVNLRYQQLSHEQLTSVFAQLTPMQRQRAFRFMSERGDPMEGGGRPGPGPDRNGDRIRDMPRDGERAPNL
ncbi:MAG: periplasmic heavy metal sensor [Pseudohongiella sp.]|jgi:uncharacterized membrane protein|nr:periplasmic heavy metal sensor [Pseudohongiella sp.]